MVLGNSFGKNRGKKYFKHTEKTDPKKVYTKKAEAFNQWFDKNHQFITNYLKGKQFYDNDTVNESYIKIYENILYTGLEVKDYKAYFFRSYYTNYINNRVRNNRYIQLLPNFDKPENNMEHFLEIETKQKNLEQDIFDYIYDRYDVREFELFKMYVSLKPAVNYASLAGITGIKPHHIQRTVSKIKKDICQHKEFLQRWKEVA